MSPFVDRVLYCFREVDEFVHRALVLYINGTKDSRVLYIIIGMKIYLYRSWRRIGKQDFSIAQRKP